MSDDLRDLIARARALAAAATPGPWEAKYDGVVPVPYVDHAVVRTMEDAVGEADAEFIAAARTLVPELCDAIEQAEQERDEASTAYIEQYDLAERLASSLVAAEARVATLEAALAGAEDFRSEIVVDAFTAPDASWDTILDSLRARIRDLSGGIPEDGCYFDPCAALGEQDTPDDRCATGHPADAVMWNPWNRVVQCHHCGEVVGEQDTTVTTTYGTENPVRRPQHLTPLGGQVDASHR